MSLQQGRVHRIEKGRDDLLALYDGEVITEVLLDFNRPGFAAFVRDSPRRHEDQFRDALELFLNSLRVNPNFLKRGRRRTREDFPYPLSCESRLRKSIRSQVAFALTSDKVR